MRAAMLALLLAFVGRAAAIDITACGTVVPEREVGVLQADLDCGTLPVGVSLQRRARLQLNGHVLSGATRAVSLDFEKGRASVEGPGEIAGAGNGIFKSTKDLGSRVVVKVSNVYVHDCTTFGVFADRVKLEGVRAERNRHGISANFKIRGSDVVASENTGFGVWAASGVVRLRNLTAQDNEWFGVIASQRGRVVLRDSTATGNAAAYGEVDIASARRPALSRVTCGRSNNAFTVFDPAPVTWGLCAND
jgi:hypothetical protein